MGELDGSFRVVVAFNVTAEMAEDIADYLRTKGRKPTKKAIKEIAFKGYKAFGEGFFWETIDCMNQAGY